MFIMLQVQCLDEVFEDGAAYALGRLNGNCWYMYTIESGTVNEPDQTLEISFYQDFVWNISDGFRVLMY